MSNLSLEAETSPSSEIRVFPLNRACTFTVEELLDELDRKAAAEMLGDISGTRRRTSRERGGGEEKGRDVFKVTERREACAGRGEGVVKDIHRDQC